MAITNSTATLSILTKFTSAANQTTITAATTVAITAYAQVVIATDRTLTAHKHQQQ